MSNKKLFEWKDMVGYLEALAGPEGSFKEQIVQDAARRGFVTDGHYRGIAYTYHFNKGRDWFELIPVCSDKDQICDITNSIPVYANSITEELPLTLDEAERIYNALHKFMFEWKYEDHYLQTNSEPPKLL